MKTALRNIITVALLLFGGISFGASFPQQGASNNTWGTELRNFFAQTYNLTTGYQISPAADVRAYGAACDGVADDTAEIQAAINANNLVYLPSGTCVISSGLTLPAYHIIYGSGSNTSTLRYTGASGYALTLGSTTDPALSYGTGARDLKVLLTQNGGNAIRLAGTAMAYLHRIYIEGVPATNTSTGVWIDGAVPSNIFTTIFGVTINHTKFGYDLSSSGVGQTTSVTAVAATSFCDVVAGSIGINIALANGDGVHFFGGNVESCETGIKTATSGSKFTGVRFEGNTTDIRLEATAQLNTFESSSNLLQSKISDASSHVSNVFLGNQAPSAGDPIPTNKLPALELGGNFTLARNQGGTRYVILTDVTTGSLALQAGPGSAALGGGLVLRGSSHADSGSVIAGLGGSGTRDFCVNSDGLGTGTDLFCVDASGATMIGPGAAPITKHLSGTGSLNFTALAANTCEVLTIPVTGAADGNTVLLGIPNALADVDGATERTTFFGWVSATDTISVRRCNVTGTITADPAAATVRADVWQH